MGGKIEPFLGPKNHKIMIFTSFLGEKSISLGGPNYPWGHSICMYNITFFLLQVSKWDMDLASRFRWAPVPFMVKIHSKEMNVFVQVLEKNVMLETILRAYFEGVLIGMYTFAILEVFCGSYCSMIFRFAGKKLNFFVLFLTV